MPIITSFLYFEVLKVEILSQYLLENYFLGLCINSGIFHLHTIVQ